MRLFYRERKNRCLPIDGTLSILYSLLARARACSKVMGMRSPSADTQRQYNKSSAQILRGRGTQYQLIVLSAQGGPGDALHCHTGRPAPERAKSQVMLSRAARVACAYAWFYVCMRCSLAPINNRQYFGIIILCALRKPVFVEYCLLSYRKIMSSECFPILEHFLNFRKS